MNGKEEVESGIVKGGMSVVLSDGKQEVVYTIVASADNAIKEAVYMMKDKTVFVPMLENNPTTVKELKEGVKVHSTAEVKIVNAEGKESYDRKYCRRNETCRSGRKWRSK